LAPKFDNEPSKTAVAAQVAPKVIGVTQASSWTRRLRWIAVAGALLGYAALSQYSASPANPHAHSIGAALAIAPVLLGAVVLLWLWTWRLTALILSALASAFLYRTWPVVERNFEWLDLAEQCGIYALVAAIFVRSLFANRVPACTQLANQMYGVLTAAEITYTRRATTAWAAFYVLLTLAILGLFFTLSRTNWYLFVNFGTWGLMLIAGVADHIIRRRVLPRREQGGMLSVIRRSFIG
jgi:uncharacterized membrane protein